MGAAADDGVRGSEDFVAFWSVGVRWFRGKLFRGGCEGVGLRITTVGFRGITSEILDV